jgi:hypothetical protein
LAANRLIIVAIGDLLQLDLVRRARAVPIWDALQAEIVVLRHQLNVLRRKSPERIAFDRSFLLGSLD